MFQNEIKVSVYGRDDFGTVDMVIWRPLDEDRMMVFREDDDGNFSWAEDIVGGEVRPSLRIPRSSKVNVLQLNSLESKQQRTKYMRANYKPHRAILRTCEPYCSSLTL